MRILLIISILYIFSMPAFAQRITHTLGQGDWLDDSIPDKSSYGKAYLFQEYELSQIIEKHIKYNQTTNKTQGWRVQIYFGSGHGVRAKAEEMKTEFEKEYKDEFPDLRVHIIYQSPFFKLRVGDFRKNDKVGALRLRTKILKKYPSSWIVADMVELIDFQKVRGEK